MKIVFTGDGSRDITTPGGMIRAESGTPVDVPTIQAKSLIEQGTFRAVKPTKKEHE